MSQAPAQYLLRFDDLCPTMARECWDRFLPLIAEFGIRPILAVVPDNRDRELEYSAPDPEFWSQMRSMEAAGAAVGLHGYRHLCVSRGRSLVPLHRMTEFAGVPEEMQRAWIREGVAILRGHGLSPRIWVAPCHGFDRAALRVLREEGIWLVSDGLARFPFKRDGLTWIPQQLWEPVEKPNGLWTICLHSNTASDSLVEKLRVFLCRHEEQFTSMDRVVAEFTPQEFGLTERLYEAFTLVRMKCSRYKRKVSRLRTRLGKE
jgi:predicted deacetylase